MVSHQSKNTGAIGQSINPMTKDEANAWASRGNTKYPHIKHSVVPIRAALSTEILQSVAEMTDEMGLDPEEQDSLRSALEEAATVA